jgi:hypothetical protein
MYRNLNTLQQIQLLYTMSENSNTIECLIHIRKIIETQLNFFRVSLNETQGKNISPFQKIDLDFQNLLENIDTTLKSECKHVYEEDYFDITPDRSQKITYCKICYCTFD